MRGGTMETGLEFKKRAPFAPSFMVELNHA